MSHQINGPQGTRFIFDPDFSGMVQIQRDTHIMEIFGEDMKHFVAEYLRRYQFPRLAKMSDDELLLG